MATSFDEQRLDPTTYHLSNPVDAIRCQNTVRDFLKIVRNDPASLLTRPILVKKFCEFLNHDDAWQIATMVGPELRSPQSHDISEGTAMDRILDKLSHRRPAPPLADPTSYQERLLVQRRIREAIAYVETGGQGALHATAEEIQGIDDLADRATSIVDPPRNPNTSANQG